VPLGDLAKRTHVNDRSRAGELNLALAEGEPAIERSGRVHDAITTYHRRFDDVTCLQLDDQRDDAGLGKIDLPYFLSDLREHLPCLQFDDSEMSLQRTINLSGESSQQLVFRMSHQTPPRLRAPMNLRRRPKVINEVSPRGRIHRVCGTRRSARLTQHVLPLSYETVQTDWLHFNIFFNVRLYFLALIEQPFVPRPNQSDVPAVDAQASGGPAGRCPSNLIGSLRLTRLNPGA